MSRAVQPKPCDVILGAAQRTPRSWLLGASIAALLLHVAGAAAAMSMVAPRRALPTQKQKPLVVIDHVVDLEPPKVVAPEPPPAPPPVEKRIKQKAEPLAKAPEAPTAEPLAEKVAPPDAPEPEQPPSEPPPAAQAAQVVAAADNAAAPAAFGIATGSGSSYAGGTTTASGTGTKANHTGQIGVGDGNGLSRARPPQLHARDWPCDWPAEADDLDEDIAYATVRVTVAANGQVQDVEVVDDPGHGFGKRASLCARSKVKFDPALDATGAPIAGKTPPLRIKFVRD